MSIATQAEASWSRILVDLLVASGSIEPDHVEEARAEASSLGTSVVTVLVRQGLVASERIGHYLSSVSGLCFVDLDTDPPSDEALAAIPAALALEHRVLGHRLEIDRLVLAVAEPVGSEAIAEIEEGSGRLVERCVLGDIVLVERLLARLASGLGVPAGTTVLMPNGDVGRAPYAIGQGAQDLQLADLDELLRLAVAAGASDLHLSVGSPPAIRVDGAIRPIEQAAVLDDASLEEMVFGILSVEQRERFEDALELDASYALSGIGRFRVSVFRQRGRIGAVLRAIPNEIPPFEGLGLPPVVASFAELRRGLVLVTGPTGSGKSTTLASIVGLINANRPLHIMTVEDPIEFEHHNQTSIVNQREVGVDTRSFAESLRHVLRQDPDVILVGEMRDLETIAIALTAAETGHLVLSTLHTPDVPQTVDRVIDVFPASQQGQIRMQLASALEAVVTQQLVIGRSGSGRVPVTEVMVCTPGVRNLIRSGKTHQLDSLIQAGGDLGMQTMDLGLARAVRAGLIGEQVAFDRAHDPAELRDYLHGDEAAR